MSDNVSVLCALIPAAASIIVAIFTSNSKWARSKVSQAMVVLQIVSLGIGLTAVALALRSPHLSKPEICSANFANHADSDGFITAILDNSRGKTNCRFWINVGDSREQVLDPPQPDTVTVANTMVGPMSAPIVTLTAPVKRGQWWDVHYDGEPGYSGTICFVLWTGLKPSW